MTVKIYCVALIVCVISYVTGKTQNCNWTVASECVSYGNINGEESNRIRRNDVNFNTSEKDPPKIQKTAKEIAVTRGEKADLSCKATGAPRPKIRWWFKHLYSPHFIEVGETSDVMRIAAELDTAGTYRCEAYNSYGKDSNEIDFIVQHPPTIKNNGKIIKAVHGSIVYLDCVVYGFPPPHVFWTLDGVTLGNSIGEIVLRNNTLRLVATAAKAGNYVCEAINKLGFARKTFQVEVYVPPQIKPPPETTIIKDAGSFLILHCEISGIPKPIVTWLFFNSDTKKEWGAKDNPGVLYLPRLRPWDSGHYLCVAMNSGGSANVTFSVQILAAPTIRKPYKPMSLMAFIGDIFVELPCLAIGNPKPTVTWSKDGADLTSGNNWHVIKSDGTLLIKYVDENANGTYKCIAKNEKGYDTDEIHVIGSQFPRQRPKRVVYLEVEKPAKINCDVSHKNTDVVRWYKGSKIIKIGELKFNSVKLSDRGLYTCRVYSFYYDVNSTMSLRVGFKPMFLSSVHQDLEFEMGRRAYLPCVARGHPYPKVKWQHNGKAINQINMVHSFVMTEETMGQYTCVASNDLGQISRNFTIFKHRANIERTTMKID